MSQGQLTLCSINDIYIDANGNFPFRKELNKACLEALAQLMKVDVADLMDLMGSNLDLPLSRTNVISAGDMYITDYHVKISRHPAPQKTRKDVNVILFPLEYRMGQMSAMNRKGPNNRM